VKLIVKRKNHPDWIFEPSGANSHRLFHCTNYGNIYQIFFKGDAFKPIWIGRYCHDVYNDRFVWITAEKEIRATSIIYEGFWEYKFNA
jgi:hypothetical protein